MSRHINCPNGHLLSVAAEHEGMTLKCPTCQAIFTIRLHTVVEVVEEVPTLTPPTPPPLPPPAPPLPAISPPASSPSLLDELADLTISNIAQHTEEVHAELPTLDVTVLEDKDRATEDVFSAGAPIMEIGAKGGAHAKPPPLEIADLQEGQGPEAPKDAIQAQPPPLDSAARKAELEPRWDSGDDDDEEDDDERRRRRKRRREGRGDRDDDYPPQAAGRLTRSRKKQQRQYDATRVGLLCYYWKFILYVGAILLVLLSFILTLFNVAAAAAAQVREDPRGLHSVGAFQAVLAIITFLGLLGVMAVAPILGIVGGAFCVRVPLKTRARGLAIATLVLDSIPVGCGILMVLTGAYSFGRFDPAVGYLSQALMIIAVLTTLAGFILFMLFLSTVAESEKDIGTSREAMSLMGYFLLTWIGGPVIILLSARLLIHLLCFGVLLLLAMVFGWFALVIKQLLGILAVIMFVRARI